MTGEVVYLFAFDVAAEIVPAKVDRLLEHAPQPLDVRQDHTSPRDVPLHQPLAVEPGVLFSCEGRPVRAQVRVFDVGVVSVLLRMAVDRTSLAEFTPFHRTLLSDGHRLSSKRGCAFAFG